MNPIDRWFNNLISSNVFQSILKIVGSIFLGKIALILLIGCMVLCISGCAGLLVNELLKQFMESQRTLYGLF